jgi:hypothetical protein
MILPSYTPASPPQDVEGIPLYLNRELNKIAVLFQNQTPSERVLLDLQGEWNPYIPLVAAGVFAPPTYRIVGDMVELDGLVRKFPVGLVINSTIAILPPEARPTDITYLPCLCTETISQDFDSYYQATMLSISPDGKIKILRTTGELVSFTGIRFPLTSYRVQGTIPV